MQNSKLTQTDGEHAGEVGAGESPYEILSYASSGGTIKMLLPPRFNPAEPEKSIDDKAVVVWRKLIELVSDGYLSVNTEPRRSFQQPFDDGLMAQFKITPAGEEFHGKLLARAETSAWSGQW